MKNIIKFLGLFLLSINLNAQNISGTYRWDYDSGRRNFVIELKPNNIILGQPISTYKGEHCGVFGYGSRMDCSYEEYSISLKRISQNIFTGTILSAYSQTISEIKITYLPDSGNIRWEVTKPGEGQSYFPYNVIMEKD